MSRRARPRVLVADHDRTFLDQLTERLLEMGLDVDFAENGRTALQLVQQESYKLIIVEIAMPMYNGLDLLRAARERNPDVPVIILTFDATMDWAQQAVQEGALGYIRRPLESIEDFDQVIYECLGLDTRPADPPIEQAQPMSGDTTPVLAQNDNGKISLSQAMNQGIGAWGEMKRENGGQPFDSGQSGFSPDIGQGSTENVEQQSGEQASTSLRTFDDWSNGLRDQLNPDRQDPGLESVSPKKPNERQQTFPLEDNPIEFPDNKNLEPDSPRVQSIQSLDQHPQDSPLSSLSDLDQQNEAPAHQRPQQSDSHHQDPPFRVQPPLNPPPAEPPIQFQRPLNHHPEESTFQGQTNPNQQTAPPLGPGQRSVSPSQKSAQTEEKHSSWAYLPIDHDESTDDDMKKPRWGVPQDHVKTEKSLIRERTWSKPLSDLEKILRNRSQNEQDEGGSEHIDTQNSDFRHGFPKKKEKTSTTDQSPPFRGYQEDEYVKPGTEKVEAPLDNSAALLKRAARTQSAPLPVTGEQVSGRENLQHVEPFFSQAPRDIIHQTPPAEKPVIQPQSDSHSVLQQMQNKVNLLQSRNQQLIELLAALPDGVLELDAGGAILSCNSIANQYLVQEAEADQNSIQRFLQAITAGSAPESALINIQGQPIQISHRPIFGSEEAGRTLVMLIQSSPPPSYSPRSGIANNDFPGGDNTIPGNTPPGGTDELLQITPKRLSIRAQLTAYFKRTLQGDLSWLSAFELRSFWERIVHPDIEEDDPVTASMVANRLSHISR
jgi:CheY-like chemotaxis protein